MKTDRHKRAPRPSRVKLTRWPLRRGSLWAASLLAAAYGTVFLRGSIAGHDAISPTVASGQPEAGQTAAPPSFTPAVSHQRAGRLLEQVIGQLAYGPALIAKVRQTVWATGREVVGVGTYEQAGDGTGQFNLQITMHDGDGKHQLHQISDGRLAWTRTEVAGNVNLRRVDVGRLDEWVRKTVEPSGVTPRLKIGGWTEMLDSVAREHQLRVDSATLKGQPMWVVTGELRGDLRGRILADSGREVWPALYPTKVRIAIAAQSDPETGIGKLLPQRIEYWSDPVVAEADAASADQVEGRLIALIEIYSIRPITPPPNERFRFDNQDAEVNFINETDRYIDRFGIELTAGERRTLHR